MILLQTRILCIARYIMKFAIENYIYHKVVLIIDVLVEFITLIE